MQVVLANLCSVEHGVEAGHFVDLHWGHLENLGGLVHGRECQEVVVLLLSDEQDWDAGRRLVVVWVLGEELLDGSVAFLRELKWTFIQVVFCVAVVSEGAEVVALHWGNKARLKQLV